MKKTKQIKTTDREILKEEQPAEKLYAVSITISSVQHKQLEILAQLAHNTSPEEYAKKVLLQHIADRLYLVQR